MTLHLIKLCVGVESLADLAHWQAGRVAALQKRQKPLELVHFTRQTPRRARELLDGGSLYWVIKGQVAARQRFLDIRPARSKDGTMRCGLVYEPKLVPTFRRAHRPFQGWRYLEPGDAPADAGARKGGKGIPESLHAELAELGLI